MQTTDDLEDRVERTRRDWQTKLAALPADPSEETSTTRAWIERHLHELEVHLERGWARISDETRAKIAEWMKRA
ncbi:MAG: hypothetical protein K8W52_13355 [Deltaproteobacteria bacterium]|nr:hypothetical protein [Deltaproteobacteria bacterium]